MKLLKKRTRFHFQQVKELSGMIREYDPEPDKLLTGAGQNKLKKIGSGE